MKWLRNLLGRNPMNGTLCSFLVSVEVSWRFMKGSCMKFEDGRSIFMMGES